MLSQLKDIGLSDKEARVYLAMLELGPAPVQKIAAQADINRPTTYVQIESLKKLGLVSTLNKGKKQLFQAESPDQLEVVVNHQVAAARQHRDMLDEVMPELKAIFGSTGEKPQVRFFEGIQGLKRMQQDFLTAKKKELWGIYNLGDVWTHFPNDNKEYTEQRLKKKIRTKSIYTTKKGAIAPRRDDKLLRESRFVPINKMPFSADISIYDNKVAVAALRGKLVGVIIESAEIANSFRGLFLLVWNTLD